MADGSTRDCGGRATYNWRLGYNDYSRITYNAIAFDNEIDAIAFGGYQNQVDGGGAGVDENWAIIAIYDTKTPTNGPYMSVKIGGIQISGNWVNLLGVNSLVLTGQRNVFGSFADSMGSGMILFKGGETNSGFEVISYPDAITNAMSSASSFYSDFRSCGWIHDCSSDFSVKNSWTATIIVSNYEKAMFAFENNDGLQNEAYIA